MNKSKKKKLLLLIIGLFLVIVYMIMSIVSYNVFRAAEPISTFSKYIALQTGNSDYVILQENPKVIVAKPRDDAQEYFLKYMEEDGYTFVRQDGGKYIFEKNSFEYHILFSSSGNHSKWIWHERFALD